jgi:transposase
MTTLADDLVPNELWALVAPLLPAPPRPPYGGRHRTISDRACFAAIVYMARTSTPWRLQVRWDRDSGRWFAFVLLACAVVCFNRL